jgi:hypothetical protein
MTELTADRPLVLIVAAKWWPLSARLAIAFLRDGCRVRAVCPAGHPLTYVSGLDGVDHYAGIDSITSLRRAMVKCRPDIVVPCDDGVVAQLHALYGLEPSLDQLIEDSLGAPKSYPIAASRYRFLLTASDLGILVPKCVRVGRAEDLVTWHEHVSSVGVLKVDGECGGNGVRICGSLDEFMLAWRELQTRVGPAASWKRFAIDRDPLALWMRRNASAAREVTIQQLIKGRPANSMLACWRGKVLAQVSVVVVASDGPTGAATIVRRINDTRMAQAAELLAEHLQLTGFYGLDFMIDAHTGAPFLIEMNPRCTQLGHLELPDQGSLAGILSAALRGTPSLRPRQPIRAETIALFPQAQAAGGLFSRYIDTGYHDIPRDEPRLVSELLLEPLPLRQLASRLYHALRPITRREPAVFENLGSAVGVE